MDKNIPDKIERCEHGKDKVFGERAAAEPESKACLFCQSSTLASGVECKPGRCRCESCHGTGVVPR